LKPEVIIELFGHRMDEKLDKEEFLNVYPLVKLDPDYKSLCEEYRVGTQATLEFLDPDQHPSGFDPVEFVVNKLLYNAASVAIETGKDVFVSRHQAYADLSNSFISFRLYLRLLGDVEQEMSWRDW